jgi:hypothetical protein
MYSYPLDMWALGCTYAELINGGHVTIFIIISKGAFQREKLYLNGKNDI